jgi:hypothetical protein
MTMDRRGRGRARGRGGGGEGGHTRPVGITPNNLFPTNSASQAAWSTAQSSVRRMPTMDEHSFCGSEASAAELMPPPMSAERSGGGLSFSLPPSPRIVHS